MVHFQQFKQRKKVWNESIPCGTFSIGGTKKRYRMQVIRVVNIQQEEQKKKMYNDSIRCGTCSTGGLKREGAEGKYSV